MTTTRKTHRKKIVSEDDPDSFLKMERVDVIYQKDNDQDIEVHLEWNDDPNTDDKPETSTNPTRKIYDQKVINPNEDSISVIVKSAQGIDTTFVVHDQSWDESDMEGWQEALSTYFVKQDDDATYKFTRKKVVGVDNPSSYLNVEVIDQFAAISPTNGQEYVFVLDNEEYYQRDNVKDPDGSPGDFWRFDPFQRVVDVAWTKIPDDFTIYSGIFKSRSNESPGQSWPGQQCNPPIGGNIFPNGEVALGIWGSINVQMANVNGLLWQSPSGKIKIELSGAPYYEGTSFGVSPCMAFFYGGGGSGVQGQDMVFAYPPLPTGPSSPSFDVPVAGNAAGGGGGCWSPTQDGSGTGIIIFGLFDGNLSNLTKVAAIPVDFSKAKVQSQDGKYKFPLDSFKIDYGGTGPVSFTAVFKRKK